MNSNCGCKECTCGANDSSPVDFMSTPWDIPELYQVSCHCVACEQECNYCECAECSCNDEVEHLGAGT